MRIILFALALVACTTLPVEETNVVSDQGSVWEQGHDERKEWSKLLKEVIDAELFEKLDKAQDISRICSNYSELSREQRITLWAQFVAAMSFYESSWKPTSRMVETTMGLDSVTGKQIASEGLLQLSYQDVKNYGATLAYPSCKFSWVKDKALSPTDPKKTIFDPLINLECGVRILAHQVEKKGNVFLTKGAYWSVIREGGRYSKIDKILAMTKKLEFCK